MSIADGGSTRGPAPDGRIQGDPMAEVVDWSPLSMSMPYRFWLLVAVPVLDEVMTSFASHDRISFRGHGLSSNS